MGKPDSFFVTGGAGFIGTALVEQMAGAFDSWTIYDNLLPQVHGSTPKVPAGAGINFVEGDIRDLDKMTQALVDSSPKIVVHLASETGTAQSADEPELHTDVNVTGTAKLIHALNSLPVKPRTIVLTSSRAVYGEGPWRDDANEIHHPLGRSVTSLESNQWDYSGMVPVASEASSTLPAPCNVYGATKLAQEHLLSSWCAAQGVTLVILRLQNVYGPGQSPINPYTGVTNFFFNQARAGKAIPVYEDGLIYRDFVFIDDVIQAIRSGIERTESGIADVGSGKKHTILQLAQIVAKIIDAPDPIITGQYRVGDVRHAACEMAKSEWVRKGKDPVELEAGLRALNDWLVNQKSFIK